MPLRQTLRDRASGGRDDATIDQDLLAEVAIALWRLERIVGAESADDRAAMVVSRLQTRLQQAGYLVEDRTGQPYDPGMPLKVLGSVTGAHAGTPVILQTASPAVLRNGRILRAGEVIVGSADGDAAAS
jgi:hypothetical protein